VIIPTDTNTRTHARANKGETGSKREVGAAAIREVEKGRKGGTLSKEHKELAAQSMQATTVVGT
jgi:hypothetical protein